MGGPPGAVATPRRQATGRVCELFSRPMGCLKVFEGVEAKRFSLRLFNLLRTGQSLSDFEDLWRNFGRTLETLEDGCLRL